jgi:hypothetical protein
LSIAYNFLLINCNEKEVLVMLVRL